MTFVSFLNWKFGKSSSLCSRRYMYIQTSGEMRVAPPLPSNVPCVDRSGEEPSATVIEVGGADSPTVTVDRRSLPRRHQLGWDRGLMSRAYSWYFFGMPAFVTGGHGSRTGPGNLALAAPPRVLLARAYKSAHSLAIRKTATMRSRVLDSLARYTIPF